jgi:hemolysin activation/secretion protein
VAKGLNDLDGRMTVPITRWDTLFELRVRQGWSEIVEFPLRKFDIKSRTHAFSLRLQQPVLRERTHAVGFFFAAEWKRGKSTLLGGLAISLDPEDDGVSTVSALRAGAEGWWRGRPRALSWRLTLSQGLDILRAGNDDLDLDGKFQSALLQMQAVEFLPWYGLRILTRLDAQIADDELVGLEQFPVGGHGSVRGFRENLLVRDEGVAGSLELRIPLPTFWKVERLELGLYSDAGYAVNRKGKSSDRIWSIGLGLHADVTRYASLSFEWAESLDDPSGDLVGNNIQDDGVHFSLHLRFP